MIRRTACLAAAAAIAALPAVPAGAATTPPWKGIYDCYTYTYPWGLTYLHSARLRANGTYQQAFNHQGATMVNPTTGTWRWNATKRRIVFKTGAFSTIYGAWSKPDTDHPKGFYNEILKNGGGQPGSCYPTQFK